MKSLFGYLKGDVTYNRIRVDLTREILEHNRRPGCTTCLTDRVRGANMWRLTNNEYTWGNVFVKASKVRFAGGIAIVSNTNNQILSKPTCAQGRTHKASVTTPHKLEDRVGPTLIRNL